MNYNELYDMVKFCSPKYLAFDGFLNSAQQILRKLMKNWKSYWESDRSGNPPRYLPKDGEYIMIFAGERLKKKAYINHYYNTLRPDRKGQMTGEIMFPEKTSLKPIRTTILLEQIREIRTLPRKNHYICEVVYKKPITDLVLNRNNVLSIDIEVNNIIVGVTNVGLRPLMIKGNYLKYIDQLTNKKNAEMRSIQDKILDTKWSSTKLDNIWKNRNNKIEDVFYETSKIIINYCISFFSRKSALYDLEE